MSVRQPDPPGLKIPDAPAVTHVLPINLVLNLYEALKVSQSRESPWLGVSVLELPLLRRQLGDKAGTIDIPRTGVYIDDVFDPSPASRAGVRTGDFLLEPWLPLLQRRWRAQGHHEGRRVSQALV